MEKIDNVSSEEKKEPSLNVDIIRHGEAKYGQGEVSMSEAQDLTEKGIEDVRASANELADLIQPDEEVEIWSSPMGRTLETAKIIAETLEQKGVHLRRKGKAKESGIKVFEQLSEVKNFSWSLFAPLINGGEIELAGKKFIVDKNLTNPNNIGYPEYFTEDAIKDITPEAKAQLPEEYVKEIEGFEKFIDATHRIMKPLSRLKKLNDKSYRVIIVTHDALSGFIANIFSGGEKKGINPGEFINLERQNKKLVATRVGGLKDGNIDIDVVNDFNDKHNLPK